MVSKLPCYRALLAVATHCSNCGLLLASQSSASFVICVDDPPFLLIAYSHCDHVATENLICSISDLIAGLAAMNSLFATELKFHDDIAMRHGSAPPAQPSTPFTRAVPLLGTLGGRASVGVGSQTTSFPGTSAFVAHDGLRRRTMQVYRSSRASPHLPSMPHICRARHGRFA